MLVLFIAYPVFYSFWVSLHEFQSNMPSRGMPFVGFQNYLDIARDERLIESTGWTFMFAAIAVPVELILGMILALILNSRITGRLRPFFRALFLVPMMLSGTVSGYVWWMLFNHEYGPINHILGLFSIKPVAWFSTVTAARAAVIMVDLWIATPFMMLILLAGLQSIAKELYEAAKIDGASFLRLFRHITLPLLKYPILVALLIRSMDALRTFDIIYLLTKGGPGTSTNTVMYYNYRYAFGYYQMGRASAISFVVLIVVVGVTLVYLGLLKRVDRQ